MSAPIVVVGSLNADLVVHVSRFPRPGETLSGNGFARFPGGKGANQAYAAARLGGHVAMVGQVGADDHGAWLAGHLAAGGVDTTCVLRDAQAPTGVALITVDATVGHHRQKRCQLLRLFGDDRRVGVFVEPGGFTVFGAH